MTYHHVSIDWPYGHTTFNIYKEACIRAGTTEARYDDSATVDDVIEYMQEWMPKVVATVNNVCPDCRTAVTKTVRR
eukprot:5286094-Prymnesium_polylepis.1